MPEQKNKPARKTVKIADVKKEVGELWKLIKPEDESGDVMPPMLEVLKDVRYCFVDLSKQNNNLRLDAKTHSSIKEEMGDVRKANQSLIEENNKLRSIFKHLDGVLKDISGVDLLDKVQALVEYSDERFRLERILESATNLMLPPATVVTNELLYDRFVDALSSSVDDRISHQLARAEQSDRQGQRYIEMILKTKKILGKNGINHSWQELDVYAKEVVEQRDKTQQELEAQIQLNGDLDKEMSRWKSEAEERRDVHVDLHRELDQYKKTDKISEHHFTQYANAEHQWYEELLEKIAADIGMDEVELTKGKPFDRLPEVLSSRAKEYVNVPWVVNPALEEVQLKAHQAQREAIDLRSANDRFRSIIAESRSLFGKTHDGNYGDLPADIKELLSRVEFYENSKTREIHSAELEAEHLRGIIQEIVEVLYLDDRFDLKAIPPMIARMVDKLRSGNEALKLARESLKSRPRVGVDPEVGKIIFEFLMAFYAYRELVDDMHLPTKLRQRINVLAEQIAPHCFESLKQ